MPEVKVFIDIEADGRRVGGFPIIRRLELDEQQSFDFEKADDGNPAVFTSIPTSELGEINVLLVRTDKQVTLRLDGQSDAGIVLRPGGLLLIFDGLIDVGAATNALVNNVAGAVATLRGLAAGT